MAEFPTKSVGEVVTAAEWNQIGDYIDRGWEPIALATFSDGPAFSVAVPGGVYSQVRFTCRGTLTDTGFLQVRVNSDATTALYRMARIVTTMESGAEDRSSVDTSNGFTVAEWSGIASAGHGWGHFARTDISTQINFEGGGARNSSNTALRKTTVSMGQLSADRFMESLQFRATGADIASIRVWVEGYRE